MTPSLNEISYSILHIVRPRVSSSEVISLDDIKFHVKNTRSLLIRNELNKSRTIDTELIQSLGCIDLELVDRSECCNVPTDCKFLRTSVRLPSAVELHHKSLITWVGPAGDSIAYQFDIISHQRVPFEVSAGNKFTKNLIKAFQMNNGGYLYLAVHPDNLKGQLIRKIKVMGVWEDPESVRDFEDCSGESCYTDNSEFPVKSWMVNAIKDIVLKNYILPESQARVDDSNDNKSNPTPQQ